jgi:hypothetical protein
MMMIPPSILSSPVIPLACAQKMDKCVPSSLSDLESEALSWLGGSRGKAAAMPTSCYNFRCAEEKRSFFAWDREFQDLWLEKVPCKR